MPVYDSSCGAWEASDDILPAELVAEPQPNSNRLFFMRMNVVFKTLNDSNGCLHTIRIVKELSVPVDEARGLTRKAWDLIRDGLNQMGSPATTIGEVVLQLTCCAMKMMRDPANLARSVLPMEVLVTCVDEEQEAYPNFSPNSSEFYSKHLIFSAIKAASVMEDTIKDQTSVSGTKGGKSSKLLRYPLRSASKPKEDKLPAPSPSMASASRRGKPTSSVSQSVDVLDMSAKEKSARPPRRLSVPSKPIASPATKSAGYITPISEARANRASNIKGKSVTPGSDVSRSLNKKKFTVLSSASYWLSHIKLSEAAGKHQLSLGFFKLALDAHCENVQLLKDELKSYASRHNLLDLAESVKELLESYGIPESIEQLQVSETCSHVPEGDNESAHSVSSATGGSKLKPKSLNNSASSAAKESVREIAQKNVPVSRIKAPMNKMEKNCKKTIKQEPNKEKQRVKNEGMIPADEKVQLDISPKVAVIEENKENMDGPPHVEEISLEA
ncbi:hypothetical protein E3N88_21010 [Mikania micrantha]|uniref:Uncharacterized protein n=1 Tax=Mikania micrantha TaxID=192012 RepID=A0A5N6NL95_9ASTR|nr:hypothetical protein E3N88_21010 [Mikania micrantha]